MAVEATVSMVKKKLKDLDLPYNYNFLLPKLKTKVEEAVGTLESITCLLKDAGYRQESYPIKEWTIEILQAVYNVEDSIDTFVLSITSSTLQRRRNLWVVYFKGIRFFNKIEKFLKKIDYCNTIHEGHSILQHLKRERNSGVDVGPSSQNVRHRYNKHENRNWQEIYDYFKHSSGIVGREEIINKVMNLLKGKDEGKRIISLYYGEGTGKSTLVRFIYNQVDVKRIFECRAWVRVSRKSVCRGVLIELWKQITLRTTSSEIPHRNLEEKELSEMIKKFLKDRKYLIILDEIGMEGVLDTLLKILPDSLNGSRVIFTARKDELPIKLLGEREENSVTISELNEIDCYDLFEEKVRIKQKLGIVVPRSIAEKTGGIPRLIEEKTGGIPLAIVLLAGALSYTEPERWWEVIDLDYGYECQYIYLEGMTLSINRKLRNILITSYDLLPTPLKPLFLYLSLFPKSFEIPVRRIFLLWIAEGLLPAGEVEPEEQARAYFMELVQRNMIEVAKWSPDGSPKTCQMPRILHEVFSRKSLRLGFFYAHKHSDSGRHDGQLFKVRRLADYYDVKNYPSTDFYAQNLRSYVSFDTHHHDVPNREIGKFLNKMIVRRGFGLLRLLDLEGVFKPILPETIGKMRHLKYVGLRWTFLDSLPSSLGNLPSLEALDVKHTNIPNLPTSIWKAEKLQHLYMNNTYLGKPMRKLSRRSLIQLKTLSGLVLGNKGPLKDGLDRITGLQKLGLTYYSTSDVETEMFNWIPKLSHLESLKLRSIDESSQPSKLNLNQMKMHERLTKLSLFGLLPATEIKFPQGIKVLTLSFSGLKQDPMPSLGQLPGLKVLKLFAKSYLGSQMTSDPGSFPKLRVLKLWMLRELEEWSVAEGAMPCLEELEIRCCEKLKNVQQLNRVTYLEELILTNMPQPFVSEVQQNMRTTCAVLVNRWTFSSTELG